MRPLPLPPNAIPRFYRGGAAISALRGVEPSGDHVPEDWVGSMTTVFGEDELGLSRLPDGRLLRDAAKSDPVAFFGPEHVATRGSDPGLLVKLLDAGERLPVHVHPDDGFAREVLGLPYGKTEAWLVVGADAGATVHVGFRDEVREETLADWVREQDPETMLAALNELAVRSGDSIFVPAGVPHAIGEGVLIVELQEPSDLSVLLEWRGFARGEDGEASLGLDWDLALRCVDRSPHEPALLRPRESGSLLPPEADRFFRAERVGEELRRGFTILVVTEGEGALRSQDGERLGIGRGDTVLVPWAAGDCRLEGELTALACRPPAPGGDR
jgi:mannose-6-phosphate isomerase